MSIDRMSAVWGSKVYPGSKHTGLARFLLVAIADNASDDGFAWPGKDYLISKTKICGRHLQRLLPILHKSGELWVEQHYEEGDKTNYIVTLGLDDETIIKTLIERCHKPRDEAKTTLAGIKERLKAWNESNGGRDSESSLGKTQSPPRGDSESPEPSCNHHLEPSIQTDSRNGIMLTHPIQEESPAPELIRIELDANGDPIPAKNGSDILLQLCCDSADPKRKKLSQTEQQRWQDIRAWIEKEPISREAWVRDRAKRAKDKHWHFPGLLGAIENELAYGDWLAGRLREDEEIPKLKSKKPHNEGSEATRKFLEKKWGS